MIRSTSSKKLNGSFQKNQKVDGDKNHAIDPANAAFSEMDRLNLRN
jgi:hypothetical protein